MNPFTQLLNDTVYIEGGEGGRTGPYKTAIGSKGGLSASILEKELDVEEGWKLIRPLPSGKEESYTILEANYSPGLHSIPPHWTLKLRKDASLVSARQPSRSTTINISNSQGIQVGDHNVQHIANSLVGLVEKLDASDAPEEEKRMAKSILRELLSNPAIAAVLGGATSGVLGMLG